MNNCSVDNAADAKDNKLVVAQQQFEAILSTFSDDDDQMQKAQFVQWLRRRMRRMNLALNDDNKLHLKRIAKRLRQLTPLEYCMDDCPDAVPNDQLQRQHQRRCSSPATETTNALLSTKQQQQLIVWPVAGAFADCKAHNTLHVDAFLFDDNDVDKMATDGILRRHFCTKCHSTDVEPFNLISHSLSIDELHHLFTVLLPSMDGKVLVDIGSRLGAVLYAAALYCPSIGRVIGIEREPVLCQLQCEIVAEFGLSPPIEVRCADVRDIGAVAATTTATNTDPNAANGGEEAENVLALADVVIMNNVFTFFADHAEQISCWQHLYAHLRPDTLLLHSPSLELCVEHLCPTALGFAFSDWLQTLHIGTAAKSTATMGTDTFSVYRIAEKK